MNKSEFFSEFLFRYQTEGAPSKVSINIFCLREGVDYGSFIRWYRENKERMREAEMEEIRVSPIHITGSVADGYNVYKLFDRENSKITRYGCMAHVRRKFVDALNTDSRSAEILSLISDLYWIESDCRIHFLTEAEREKERKRRSVPVLSDIWQCIKAIFDETKDYSSNLFIKAVRYAVNEWNSVCRYVTNGRAEIDNNTAERMMELICLGRNNYLFCGSELGARNASLLYSIIETCKMNGLRPVKYLADVLRKLVAGETDYTALLPTGIAK